MAGVAGLEPTDGGIKTRCLTNLAIPQQWCGRRDLNSHAVKHWNLNPACLPIPPLPHFLLRITFSGKKSNGGYGEIRTCDPIIMSDVL